ncbi:dethiobiotin synthase [Planctopirus limnophila DSM 3776]|uniref:ATP-dependent dethiobiotin synthetase BioD n=2 Tax=Planctopirus limnophila TaxID=120 RepID=D5SQC2_PLAL2|nr:dethiobiotin synthase [Planctopirus limnophila DSM 3776]
MQFMALLSNLRGLFVTGTDTDVGKTYVSCRIIEALLNTGHNVGAYKPACSGAIVSSLAPSSQPEWHDVNELWSATGQRFPKSQICPQCFLEPLAPPLAAAREGRTVSAQQLRSGVDWWLDRVDLLLIEGAGGIFAPISEQDVVLDLAVDLGFPMLIVARPGLGTINHTLLTIAAIRQRGLPIAGVVMTSASPFDQPSVMENIKEITARSGVPVLAVIEPDRPWPVTIDPADCFSHSRNLTHHEPTVGE